MNQLSNYQSFEAFQPTQVMNRNRLPNRYSLPLKSAAIAVGPSGLLPVHGFPAADFPPTLPKAAAANAAVGVAATTVTVRSLGLHKTPRMFTRTCAPSLWCCGVVVGVIFCLMNRQVNAAPVGETSIDRRFIRSVADQILDQLEHDHEQMVADGSPGVRAKRSFDDAPELVAHPPRTKRHVGQLNDELRHLWEQNQASAMRPTAGSARVKRTSGSIQDEVKNFVESSQMDSITSEPARPRTRRAAAQILEELRHALQESEQKSAQPAGSRTKRTAAEILNQVRNSIESNLESGASEGAGARRKRTTGSILDELKDMWEREQVKDGKPVAGVRTRRTAATILNEIENRLNQPKQPTAATSVRGKRSACSEPDNEATAAAEAAEAKRSFADQRLADFLVRQRLFKLKPESALRGEGGGEDELEDSFDVNLFGKE